MDQAVAWHGKREAIRPKTRLSSDALSYDAFDPNRMKHLELIQAVISRLGNDAFLVKGWAVTFAGVLIGFGVDREKPELALVALIPTVLFWLLDAYYLRSERLFRKLYDAVRSGDSRITPFQMNATDPDVVEILCGDGDHDRSRRQTLKRPTLAIFYGSIALAALGVAGVLH